MADQPDLARILHDLRIGCIQPASERVCDPDDPRYADFHPALAARLHAAGVRLAATHSDAAPTYQDGYEAGYLFAKSLTPSDVATLVVAMEQEGVVTWGDPRHRARFLAAVSPSDAAAPLREALGKANREVAVADAAHAGEPMPRAPHEGDYARGQRDALRSVLEMSPSDAGAPPCVCDFMPGACRNPHCRCHHHGRTP